MAQKSLTLLSNRSSGPGTAPSVPPVPFLPLKREDTRSMAVIGPAGDQDYPTGNYYGTPARKVGVAEGLREVLGAGATMDYEKGADFVGPANPDGGGARGGAGEEVGRRGPLSRHEPAGRSRGPRPP